MKPIIFKNNSKKRSDFLNTKIESICSDDDLRPAMNCVYFKDGYLYATNALIAIKQKLSLHGIHDDIAKHLDGKLLHRSHLAMMKKCDYFEIVQGGIKSKKGMVEMIHLFMEGERYPDVDAIIPRTGFVELDSICVNADLLKKTQDVLFMVLNDTYKFLKLRFRQKNQAIVITTNLPEEDQIAIIMPVYGRD